LCLRCGYDVGNTGTNRCPECGTAITSGANRPGPIGRELETGTQLDSGDREH
jgi:hypothetical protein